MAKPATKIGDGPVRHRAGRPVLTVALTKYLHVAPLHDRAVTLADADLEFVALPDTIVQVFRAMARNVTWDIAEMGLSTAWAAKFADVGLRPIPVFATRRWDTGDIWVDTRRTPPDPTRLAGSRIAVRSPYVTDSVWTTGILMDRYDVEPSELTWVMTGTEHLERLPLPENVEHQTGADPWELLSAGAVDAVMGLRRADDPAVQSAIPDAEAIKAELLAEYGAITMHHVIVVADRVRGELPDIDAQLAAAFEQAKRPFLQRLACGIDVLADYTDSLYGAWHDYGVTKTRELGRPDPMPYGIERNRRMLADYVRYGKAIGLLPGTIELEDLFALSWDTLKCRNVLLIASLPAGTVGGFGMADIGRDPGRARCCRGPAAMAGPRLRAVLYRRPPGPSRPTLVG
jgi:4,5-dihydroxyphthalate decarboxylase